MSDRELLELAAKAIFIEAVWSSSGTMLLPKTQTNEGCDEWNPLTDDGDAMRLAAALPDVTVVIDNHMNWCGIHLTAERGKYDLVEYFNGDRAYSIRLAIVRAAAEIGKAMQAGS
jgi:hypothetical protein